MWRHLGSCQCDQVLESFIEPNYLAAAALHSTKALSSENTFSQPSIVFILAFSFFSLCFFIFSICGAQILFNFIFLSTRIPFLPLLTLKLYQLFTNLLPLNPLFSSPVHTFLFFHLLSSLHFSFYYYVCLSLIYNYIKRHKGRLSFKVYSSFFPLIVVALY